MTDDRCERPTDNLKTVIMPGPGLGVPEAEIPLSLVPGD